MANLTPSQEVLSDLTSISQRNDAELDRVLTVLRGRIDEEFRISERLDTKARQGFATAAAFFAGAQAAAVASLAQANLGSVGKLAILASALAAAIALGVVANLLHSSEKLREERDLLPEDVMEWCCNLAEPNAIAAHLIQGLAEVASYRATSNAARVARCEDVSLAARWTLLICGIELACALATRI